MLDFFENYVTKNSLFSRKTKLLLALSGGEDSVCLFHLLLKGGYNFSVAHCNFQLRGADSDKDEAFVKKLCNKHNIVFHCMRFETQKESRKLKLGIQETARKLRYSWFEDLIHQEHYERLLTAHHAGDNTETMLINLLRSTGVPGLHGILPVHGYVVRPLLFADRKMISAYVKKHKLKFRLDKSNLKDDYLRNYLRHHVVPGFRKVEPKVDEVFLAVSAQVREYEEMAEELMQKQWQELSEQRGNGFHIAFSALGKLDSMEVFMYYKLRHLGFNRSQVGKMIAMQSSQTGKMIRSADWVVTRERDGLVFTPEKEKPKEIFIHELTKKAEYQGIILERKKINARKPDFFKHGILFADIDKCTFPLTLRSWRNADRMQPLGMKGSKKVSDILTDKKVQSSKRKEFQVLIDHSGKIIALPPLLINEQFKLTGETRSVLSIHLKNP